jgi:hypothetical protein
MGCLMKNHVIPHHLLHESFVLQIDGRVKSSHRRFVDALRAGLLLKDQFPNHNIKVRALTEGAHVADEMPTIAVH